MFVAGAERQIRDHCRALVRRYDTVDWWPAKTRFEIMVGAVLVQNTRWANVVPAVATLRRAGLLQAERLTELPADDIAELIRSAGCQTVKARRLSALAHTVCGAGGLRRLASLSNGAIRRRLLATHGIGFETADAILAFAFDRPVFIADAYARRWFTRLGICHDSPRYEALREVVETALPKQSSLLRDVHAAIVLHAQQYCGRRPDCQRCALRQNCRSGFIANRGSGR